MPKDTIRIGFYGVGTAAQPYLDALARRPDATLAGVCDQNSRAAEQVASGWGASVFPGWETLLQQAQPDAAWICVSSRLQSQAVVEAIDRNIPFFILPPGATDFASAVSHCQQVLERRLVTAVGFATHFTDVAAEAREYLGANPVPLALGWWLRPPVGDEGPEPSALSLLWNDACRLIDVLRYFCGEVQSVQARIPDKSPGGLVVQLQFKSGSVGVLTCAAFPRPEPRVQLELLGDGWSLEFGGPGNDASQLLAPLRLVERDRTTILRCLNSPPADQVAAFVEAVRTQNPNAVAPGYADALPTMAVCHAAALSVREGRMVELTELAQ
jgi:predicted dehydrogenase